MSEQNKRIAIAFYEKLINEFDPESALRYMAAKLISNIPR